MRRTAFYFAVFSWVACAIAATPPKSIADQKRSVIQVIATHQVDNQGKEKQDVVITGTGFVVAPGDMVVTASHVVVYREPSAPTDVQSDFVFKFSDGVTARYANKILVKLSGGREIAATPVTKLGILQANMMRDYCVLKLSEKLSTPTLELGEWNDLMEGDDLTAWGFPLGLPGPVLIKATVALKTEQAVEIEKGKASEQVRILIFQGPNNKGMSGGRVLQNRTGKVVGVVSTRLIGITQELDRVRQQVLASRNSGSVFIQGVSPNETSLEIINVLDNYLMSGMGSAVSTDPIKVDLRPSAK